ncbi:MAG: class I SAM-dependent methyltransferase, partial [Alphaproteobacteria bacterium]|nr:class I SAM-dependent methyltransferase [Alphaproteobacteria bacterium]
MPKLPLAVPKSIIPYKFYFLLFSAIYFLTPIFLFYFSQLYIVYYAFFFAWYAPFFVIVILLAYIEDIERKRRRIREPIQFIRQKHYTPQTNPRLAPICGAEIGVDRGAHALDMLNYLNLKKLYLIDPWERYKDHDVEGFPDDNSDEIYQSVNNMFSDYENVEIIRETSVDASELIEDSTLDFVYIDANHEYEHVLADLRAWYPKL